MQDGRRGGGEDVREGVGLPDGPGADGLSSMSAEDQRRRVLHFLSYFSTVLPKRNIYMPLFFNDDIHSIPSIVVVK